MKFTRLMNQSNARISSARSSAIGIASRILICGRQIGEQKQDRSQLQREARDDRDRPEIVDHADHRKTERGSHDDGDRIVRVGSPEQPGQCRRDRGRGHHGDAAALRRRRDMRRPRVRSGQRIALKQGAEHHDQARAYQRSCDWNDESQDNAVRI